jgi:hypothetical protein
MRKQDLIEGEEYAAGSTSRYDRWNHVRVKLIAIDGEADVPRTSSGVVFGTYRKHGIVVELMERSTQYGWRGEAGDLRVFDSARDIHEPWSAYAERKAEHDREIAAVKAEVARKREVADSVIVRLRQLGIADGVKYGEHRFKISPDAMAQIVAMIPEESR